MNSVEIKNFVNNLLTEKRKKKLSSIGTRVKRREQIEKYVVAEMARLKLRLSEDEFIKLVAHVEREVKYEA